MWIGVTSATARRRRIRPSSTQPHAPCQPNPLAGCTAGIISLCALLLLPWPARRHGRFRPGAARAGTCHSGMSFVFISCACHDVNGIGWLNTYSMHSSMSMATLTIIVSRALTIGGFMYTLLQSRMFFESMPRVVRAESRSWMGGRLELSHST